MNDDHKLVRRILSGDKEAFDQLVRKHYQNIYSYCYRRTFDKNIAADLTQDVFLKLVSSIYHYSLSGKFSNFLFTIAVNTCNDYFRKQGRALPEETLSEGDKSPDDAVIQSEENALVRKRLAQLPDAQQQALILYYYHGFKAKDIAKITNTPLPTVKSRIHQGLEKLRKLYGKDE